MLGMIGRAALPLLALCAIAAAQTPKPGDLGFKDTPVLPGLPWHVHDPDRPHPPTLTPPPTPGGPPSDAIVLFGGKDLSQWEQHVKDGSAKAPCLSNPSGFTQSTTTLSASTSAS